jgi:hypothetical protein
MTVHQREVVYGTAAERIAGENGWASIVLPPPHPHSVYRPPTDPVERRESFGTSNRVERYRNRLGSIGVVRDQFRIVCPR